MRASAKSLSLRALICTGVAGALTASAALPAFAASVDPVRLTFDNVAVGGTFTTLVNSGTAAATSSVSIVTDGTTTGKIMAATSAPGNGSAADFPNYNATSGRAMVVVRNTTTTDVMNPGAGRLEFGADMMIDSGTTATAGTRDDGNNAVQRGLWDDPAQFKLQVDGGKPNCRIKGATGAVEVTSSVTLTPGTRYRVRCIRSSTNLNSVRLSITPFKADGTLGTAVDKTAYAATGVSIGALNFAITTPMSAGGKTVYDAVTKTVKVNTSASDQFNGTLDNVLLRLG